MLKLDIEGQSAMEKRPETALVDSQLTSMLADRVLETQTQY